MKNLSGDRDCDRYIEKELHDAGIELVRGEQSGGEVPATIIGQLGRFKFTRAWYYWIVSGKMPLSVAEELYADPIGKKDVRVAGHCGCPAPEHPWIEWEDNEGRRIFPMSKRPKNFKKKDESYPMFFKNPSKAGKGFIPCYHIDSEEGLKLFAEAIRKYQLL